MLLAYQYTGSAGTTTPKMNPTFPSSNAMQNTMSMPTTKIELGERSFNGRCKYKSGRCMNERTLKENGQPHTLCEEHRVLHNKNQRKSDTKRRRIRKGMPYEPRVAPTIQLIHDLEYRSTGSTYSSEHEDARSNEEQSDDETNNQNESKTSFLLAHESQPTRTPVVWSDEEIRVLYSLLGIRDT